MKKLESDIFSFIKDLSLICILLLYITPIKKIYILVNSIVFFSFGDFYILLYFEVIIHLLGIIYLQLIRVIKNYVPRFFKINIILGIVVFCNALERCCISPIHFVWCMFNFCIVEESTNLYNTKYSIALKLCGRQLCLEYILYEKNTSYISIWIQKLFKDAFFY